MSFLTRFGFIKFSMFILLNLFQLLSLSQNKKIDSLKFALTLHKEDTNKVNSLIKLSGEFLYINSDTGIIIGNQALQLAKKNGWKHGIALSEHQIGRCYTVKGESKIALGHYNNAIAIWEELIKSPERTIALQAKIGIAKIIGNIASVYSEQANYSKALEYYFKSLKMADELDLQLLKSANYSNMGALYKLQGEYLRALDYFSKSLIISDELGMKSNSANTLSNIGVVYFYQGKKQKALEYDFKALKISEELGLKYLQANILCNIGGVYSLQGDSAVGKGNKALAYKDKYSKSLNYYFKALTIHEELGVKQQVAFTFGNIGTVYAKTERFTEAEAFLKKAMAIATELNVLDLTKTFESYLCDFYSLTNRPALALTHYRKYIAIRDTISSRENQKNQVRVEMNYEFEKKELEAKAEQDIKDSTAAEEKQKQNMVLFFVIGGLVLVIVFSGFLYNRFKITQRQKKIIEQQKYLVEEHQKEILDSITYAKRLQEAILPPIDLIKKQLPNSFVFYKPKAIVAGDFYWMETIGDNIFIAAADCTGHGVPGAMVSVVCSNALNRTVKEFNLNDTGKILDKTRELVLETFEKGNNEVKDGMDISLLCINKKNEKIFWSGANNPLWYISPLNENNGQAVLHEIKADKQPIGKTDQTKPFTTHQIDYKENTTFYLFTDGLADQFGGPKGKKFKYKQFSTILVENNSSTLEQQAVIINKYFEYWMGDLEQVDDVCVIGIRI